MARRRKDEGPETVAAEGVAPPGGVPDEDDGAATAPAEVPEASEADALREEIKGIDAELKRLGELRRERSGRLDELVEAAWRARPTPAIDHPRQLSEATAALRRAGKLDANANQLRLINDRLRRAGVGMPPGRGK